MELGAGGFGGTKVGQLTSVTPAHEEIETFNIAVHHILKSYILSDEEEKIEKIARTSKCT